MFEHVTPFVKLQLFAGTLTGCPSFLSIREFGTLKKFGWTWVYLLKYCTDLGDLIGNIYLFYQGYLAVLSVLGYIRCVRTYRHNKTEEPINLVLFVAW